MALLGWSLDLPINPDVSAFYTPEVDIPGSGFNFGSFYNEELNSLLADARNPELTNGCDPEVRRELYLQAQEILFNELPYMYMYVGNSMIALQPNVEGFDPLPFSRTWNLDAWSALQPVE
ncbi:MAG: hypothetical protein HC927_11695 [Deltaproteobacteria bacterium]|nr:hypothetical protein [Deltaproteobacteria bacterium]